MSKSIQVVLLWIGFTLQHAGAQEYAARLIDSETTLPIPYASIVYGESLGVITNDEGYFQFGTDTPSSIKDSITISCMGYQKKTLAFNTLKDSIILLQPGGFELEGVALFGKGLTAEEIVSRMLDSIPVNYPTLPVRKKFFLRQSTVNEIDALDIELKSSTIKAITGGIIDSLLAELPKKTEYHTETYGELFKAGNKIKLTVEKATEMYDKERQATYTGLNHALKKILGEHTKEDSYFKIKSGPISTKMDMDSIIGNPAILDDPNDSISSSIKRNYLTSRINRVTAIEQQVFGTKSRLDLLSKHKNYTFTKEESIEKEEERYYVLSFTPKKKGKLRGKIYINAIDFALVRLEYENLVPIKGLKLLGIDYKEPQYQGVAMFSKMNNGQYELQFSSLKHHFFVDVRRPFKIAEKNKSTKGRRKQNEITLDLYLTAKSSNVFEWVALESKPSSQSTFNSVPQSKLVEVVYRTQYDSGYWDGNTIFSPSAAIKSYTVFNDD